jgi:hypothetical protein
MADNDANQTEPSCEWWRVEHPAVHKEYLLDDKGTPTLSMLRHATYPFACKVSACPNQFETDLRRIACDYVERAISPTLASMLRLRQNGKLEFGWLGTLGESIEPRHTLGSFWVQRQVEGTICDRTAVLLAGYRTENEKGEEIAFGGRTGLRVVAHVETAVAGHHAVRISGASMRRLPSASATTEWRTLERVAREFRLEVFLLNLLTFARTGFNFAVGDNDVVFTGFNLREENGQPLVLITGRGRNASDATRIEAFTVEARPKKNDDNSTSWGFFAGVSFEQSTAATQTPITVFSRDAATRGSASDAVLRAPSRDTGLLAAYRDREARLPACNLEEPGLFEVLQRRVQSGTDSLEPVPSATVATLRSDALAAVHAFERAREFFERLNSYGFVAEELFRQARLPLRMRPRAALPGAANGNATNARVALDSPGVNIGRSFDPDKRPRLEVLIGSAAPRHRWAATPTDRVSYLGLAADPRWIWHEFGHVLCFAATGELEYPFAHSAGDALAAVIHAPDTAYAIDDSQDGLTYPWVLMRRRHDRTVADGWCWCGRRNHLRLSRESRLPRPFSEYVEEQMLSSSIYTLYRALGGETRDGSDAARHRRRVASDYVIYLLIRANALLGPWELVPAASADQFVSALIDADVGTAHWHCHSPWYATPFPCHSGSLRMGGSAHKVVRWAFEQQGLFATNDPGRVAEGVGRPHRVDLFIPGLGSRRDGGYHPVSLQWSDQRGAAWHSGGIHFDRGCLQVTWANRGDHPTGDISMRVWIASREHTLRWSLIYSSKALAQLQPQGRSTLPIEVDSRHSEHAQGIWVLAEVSCAGDLANTDPSSALACAIRADASPPTDHDSLIDLVAGDNNLGLALITFGCS